MAGLIMFWSVKENNRKVVIVWQRMKRKSNLPPKQANLIMQLKNRMI